VRILVSAHLAGAERVMDGDRGAPDIRIDLGIRAAIRARAGFGGDKRRERRLTPDVACQLHTGAQSVPVFLAREEILLDARRLRRIARGERDLAAAVRTQ